MSKQKVITINILLNKDISKTGFLETEPKQLNEYLHNGYKVVDRFSTVANAGIYVINITFILEKDEESQ